MKMPADKQRLIEAFREAPIILFACRKAGVHRSTFYRWLQEDPIFAAEVNKAFIEGSEKMCDMAQSNLLVGLKNQQKWATLYVLTHFYPKYMTRINQLFGLEQNQDISPEQIQIITEALKLLLKPQPAVVSSPVNKINDQTYAEGNSTEKTISTDQ